MDKTQLSERDICTKFITPAVKRAGWDEMPQIREVKFRLVRNGVGPDEIIARIDQLAARYEADVRAVDPGAADYETARAAALRLVRAAWR